MPGASTAAGHSFSWLAVPSGPALACIEEPARRCEGALAGEDAEGDDASDRIYGADSDHEPVKHRVLCRIAEGRQIHAEYDGDDSEEHDAGCIDIVGSDRCLEVGIEDPEEAESRRQRSRAGAEYDQHPLELVVIIEP